MLFHTWVFAVFIAVVLPVYWGLRRFEMARMLWVLAASWLFYAWWDVGYLGLIVYSTWLDWYCVRRMERGGSKPFWVATSVINNLGLLAFFKYAKFLAVTATDALEALGAGVRIEMPDLVLPVGISFYTFQSMSYTIDYARGQLPAERSFVRFAAYVALFPQLVAGPIERASHLLPQLRATPRWSATAFADGASLFLTGLFKKLILASYLAAWVDPVYARPAEHSGSQLLAATFFFAWQIYFDFSGYTDMARGVARAMGLDLMLNFRRPYLATSLGDFWLRWHISLSTWFRDYVYIPLGGGRGGRLLTARNIAITMLLSGIWHGSSQEPIREAMWTFVVWGALHAVGHIGMRSLERRAGWSRVPVFLKRALVFVFVLGTWVFFRASTCGDAVAILGRIVTEPWSDPGAPFLLWGLVAAVWIHQMVRESARRSWLEVPVVQWVLAIGMLVWIVLFPPAEQSAFIYFQF